MVTATPYTIKLQWTKEAWKLPEAKAEGDYSFLSEVSTPASSTVWRLPFVWQHKIKEFLCFIIAPANWILKNPFIAVLVQSLT